MKRLAEGGISYCVVGGVAVNLHGIPRMTYDVDLVVDLYEENLEALDRALLALGLKCNLPLEIKDFADEDTRKKMKKESNLVAITYTDPDNPLHEADIIVWTPIPPSELIDRAVELDLEGVVVKVVSIDDLITLKRDSGRLQDQDDLKLLEEISNERQ